MASFGRLFIFPTSTPPPYKKMEPHETILFLRDKLNEEQKEAIWDSISNKKTWMEITNLNDKEKAELILDTWNQIKQKEVKTNV